MKSRLSNLVISVSSFPLFCQCKVKILKHHKLTHKLWTDQGVDTILSTLITWNLDKMLTSDLRSPPPPSRTPKKKMKKNTLECWACCMDQHQHRVGLWGGGRGGRWIQRFTGKNVKRPKIVACVREQQSGVLVNFVFKYRSLCSTCQL